MPLSFATLYGNIGFTGLVNDKEVSLFKSIQDGEDNIKRVIEGVDLVKDMESLSVWASLYGYQDMGSLITNSPYYIGAGVKGSLLSDIYYTVRGNFKTGVSPYTKTGEETVESALILAGMGAFSIDWYMNIDKDIIRMLTPSMSLNIGISSGDSDLDDVQLGSNSDEALESISLYSPMGASGPGVVYSTSNQNLLYIKYVGSVAPFKTLQVQLESALFMRTVSGVSGNSDVMSDATGNYLGTEVSVSANYRPFSDLGISVSGGMFIPNKDVMTSGDPTGMLTAYVSLSL
ncbi:MAG: hypothetical protein B6229_09430 [Spirochaetaceae bacterium 4572_7]|nr:MAG: hypothetical protein B6229_09430 [Spirochaetaceae bacterium 4572_7]